MTKSSTVQKNKDINNLTNFVGFINLIEHSFKLLFPNIISNEISKSNVNIWEDRQVELKFDLTDSDEENSIIELTNKTKNNTINFKKPIINSLEKLQGENFQFNYKDNKNKSFNFEITFYFFNQVENYYPVKVNIKLKNVPSEDDVRRELILLIWYSLSNYIKDINNLPNALINKKAKFKTSGHYIDQKLKHNFENEKKGQLNLFEIISPKIRSQITNEVIVEGIRISVAEDKLLNSILKLLHFKSNHKGNMPSEKLLYGGQLTEYPVLKVTPSELYKEFTNRNDYSGKDIQNIKEIFKDLQERKFLIIYKRHRKNEKGIKVIDRIEEYQPLIKVMNYYEELTEHEDSILDAKGSIGSDRGEIILMLNPIFVDQIDTKFIDYPTDINKLTSIAAGGPKKVTESITLLRDYLIREISSKRKKTIIDVEKLHYIIGLEKYIKQKRKKLINERTSEAIEAITNLGIISKTEYIKGSKDQEQIIFYLNSDF